MRLFYTGIEKFLIPLTDRLLAVSEAEADLARRIGYRQSAIRIIRNGTEKASEDVVSGNEAPCKIGMVGALRAQKDPLTFVRACAIVHRRFPDAVFEICGAGELEGAVNAEVMKLGLAETFRCRGHATNIRERLRQWDIFALSSRFEGLPYALLEAMAMGKPVVASRVSGVEEVVVNGRDGILVPANDPGAMAGALTVLVENQSMRAEMGRAAADRVRLLYTKERQLTELETFYLSSTRRK